MTSADRTALAEFFGKLAEARDPWFLALQGRPAQEGPRADMRYLVLAVMGQDLAPLSAGRILAALEDGLGEELPKAGLLPFARVCKACEDAPGLGSWKHATQLPGLLLACSDYLRAGPPLRERLERQGPSGFVRELANAIPFAGRNSPWRQRPWRLARWIVRGEAGCEPLPQFFGQLHVPPAVVVRALRFLDLQLSPEGIPARQQAWSDAFCREFSDSDPASLWVPLTLLRRPRGKVWACEEYVGRCDGCPLRRRCDPPPRA